MEPQCRRRSIRLYLLDQEIEAIFRSSGSAGIDSGQYGELVAVAAVSVGMAVLWLSR
jgi:hypothetical protein